MAISFRTVLSALPLPSKLRIALVAALPVCGPLVHAEETDWWAFQKVKRPAVPRIGSGLGEVDRFIRARLTEAGLEPAPPAQAHALVRRVHNHLIGLPPDRADIDAFANDIHPQAYERLLDRLLASPRFGERWARHWLDVVRFAETNGYERDEVKPNLWKYRDWVVQAFNEDMPYDRFLLNQLAGDEIPGRTVDSVVATGMLRAGTWNDEPNDPEDYKYERLEDMVDVVSTAFLGVTVRCARCHDHKFDPIPQVDYYRFAAAFWAGPIEPRDRALMGGATEEELGVRDVFGWTDRGREVPDFHLLVKGDAERPGPVVAPGVLTLASFAENVVADADAATTRRRLSLGRWMIDRRHPLTSRVMVNRIWQQLFGDGLVGTPDNFGVKGELPTHPELLDWLATKFMDGGWSVKPMLRRLMLSETYRQASVRSDEDHCRETDVSNRSLWRMNRRRLDAEALRDALLEVSGGLETRLGGPSFYPRMSPEVLEGFSRKSDAWQVSSEAERSRRSLYMMSKRQLLLPLMTVFDFPNSEKPCGKRDVTTVAPQALALLNNAFVHECSRALARRAAASGDRVEKQIQAAWRMALGREADPEELRDAAAHYEAQLGYAREKLHAVEVFQGNHADPASPAAPEEQALASVCHVLLNTNEFLYVD